jgi:agmatinase/guanidinopropionase
MSELPASSSFAAQPYEGIATFARQPHTRDLKGVDVAVLGFPYDGSTSYRSGTRLGPRAIREQSLLLWGYNNGLGVAPFQQLRVVDYGDVSVVPVDVQETHRAIEMQATQILQADTKLLSLGGDHSIALPLLRAHAKKHGPVAVLHFDAHPDTWDSEFGQYKFSHGTPFRRAIEEGLIDTSAYVQLGIRGPTAGPQDYLDAVALGARMITFDEYSRRGAELVLEEVRQRIGTKAVYLSFDIDAIDPAFAPGTGTPEIGGFSSYQALQLLRGLAGLNFVGFDLVEVSPPFDPSQITAILAANLAFEFLSLLAKGPSPGVPQ